MFTRFVVAIWTHTEQEIVLTGLVTCEDKPIPCVAVTAISIGIITSPIPRDSFHLEYITSFDLCLYESQAHDQTTIANHYQLSRQEEIQGNEQPDSHERRFASRLGVARTELMFMLM